MCSVNHATPPPPASRPPCLPYPYGLLLVFGSLASPLDSWSVCCDAIFSDGVEGDEGKSTGRHYRPRHLDWVSAVAFASLACSFSWVVCSFSSRCLLVSLACTWRKVGRRKRGGRGMEMRWKRGESAGHDRCDVPCLCGLYGRTSRRARYVVTCGWQPDGVACVLRVTFFCVVLAWLSRIR